MPNPPKPVAAGAPKPVVGAGVPKLLVAGVPKPPNADAGAEVLADPKLNAGAPPKPDIFKGLDVSIPSEDVLWPLCINILRLHQLI